VRQFLQSACSTLFGYLTRVTPVYRCLLPLRVLAFGYVKRVRHILASPEYAPGIIAVNVTWIEREFNACQTHRSMYPSIFNRFPVIQAVSLKVRHFSTLFAHFGLPWDNRGKYHTVEKRIQFLSNARCIYPSIFNLFPVIQLVSSNVRHFSTFCTFWPPLGTPLGKSQ